MKKKLLLTSALIAMSLTPSAFACDIATSNQIRSSNLDDAGKVNMLKAARCDATDLIDKINTDREAGLKNTARLNAQKEQKQKADREAIQERRQAEATAAIQEDNARQDAFDQAMADKCGEYPMSIKIGFSEKLLKMNCAGSAQLVGESSGGRVYRVDGAFVSTQRGKVVRWWKE